MNSGWKVALARQAVKDLSSGVKDLLGAVLPVRPAVTAVRVARDIVLSKLGSARASARISLVAACLMQEPPRLPSGDELKVVSMLARKR
jgi:hypothetical protein